MTSDRNDKGRMHPDDSSSPEFWDRRYVVGRIPWDQHGAPVRLVEYLRRTPVTGRALVPGCGSGYEVRALHDNGWPVIGLDFSPAAVERCRCELGPKSHLVRVGDFFSPAPDLSEFSLVYERTFLCALPPDRHPSYGRRMAELIAPGGVLCGHFFFGPEEEPPPYPLSKGQFDMLLGGAFELVEDLPVPDSLPLYAGKERWQVWRRR